MSSDRLTTEDKALKINLKEDIYGCFAEIGAGQEVAANFFKAGGSSGTCRRNQTKQTPRNAAGQSGQRKYFQAAGSAQKRRAGRT